MQHDARIKRFTHAIDHCPPCNGRLAQHNGVFATQWRFCYAMAFLLRNGFEIKGLKEMPLREMIRWLVFLREEASSWQN